MGQPIVLSPNKIEIDRIPAIQTHINSQRILVELQTVLRLTSNRLIQFAVKRNVIRDDRPDSPEAGFSLGFKLPYFF